MEFSLYLPHKSKRRVFPGSSSSYVDPGVGEISPLGVQLEESRDMQGFYTKVADGDIAGDYGDLMPTDETVGTKIKGKGPLINSYGENSSSNLVEGGGSSNKSSPQNSFSQYVSDHDDDFVGIYEDSFTYEDDFTYDDDYTFLQAHFDSMDIPTGVEVPVPSLFDPSQSKNNTSAVNCSSAPIQFEVSSGELVHPSQAVELTKAGKKPTYLSSSSSQTPKPTLKMYSHSSPGRFKKMKKLSAPTGSQGRTNPPFEFKPWLVDSFHGETEYNVYGNSSHSNSYKQHLKNMYSGRDKSPGASFLKHKKAAKHLAKKTVNVSPEIDVYMSGWQDSTYTNQVFSGPQMNQGSVSSHQLTNQATAGPPQYMNQGFTVPPPPQNLAYPYPPPYMNQVYTGSPMMNQMYYGNDPFQEPSNVENNKFFKEDWGIPWAQHPAKGHKSVTSVEKNKIFKDDWGMWAQHPAKVHKGFIAEGSSWVPSTSATGIEKCLDADDVLKKFHLFKQFDTVGDHADHHYSSQGSQVKQPPKKWAKKIQDEWRILEKDLPDSIYVRVYESRMDLMRAVIVGAEGTPYHDGLFFFDIFFPSSYPDVPPLVYYHSGGLRINPNLYNNGKVCLSLLNTWSGRHTEKWVPGLSTMLQVLVSIQALILNAKPFFNEPGYATMSGSFSGERQSQQYNESTFVLSLRTMVYTIRRRPKHFEDFVVGHFLERAQDILLACKAYIEGAQVGCLTRGGVQDVEAGGKCCSSHFRNTVASCIPWLVKALSDMGAKDCDKFLPLAEKVHTQPTPLPVDRAASASANLYDEPTYESSEWSDFVIYA